MTADDTILDLLNHPAFAGFARLLLPRDDRGYDNSMRLRNIGSLLPYHSHVDPGTAVSALNHMIDDVTALRRAGTEVEFHRYSELGHGFGPGTGTSAEGWLDRAVRFWERIIKSSIRR